MTDSRDQSHVVRIHPRRPTVESVTAELDELESKLSSYTRETDSNGAKKALFLKIFAVIENEFKEIIAKLDEKILRKVKPSVS